MLKYQLLPVPEKKKLISVNSQKKKINRINVIQVLKCD